jgi:peptidoglycan/LPS O-acetylase OafA/YrhL
VVFATLFGLFTLFSGYRKHRALRALRLLVPGLAILWFGVLYAPLHHASIPHAVTMTIGGALVGMAHLANLRLNNQIARRDGHVHSATCGHGMLARLR